MGEEWEEHNLTSKASIVDTLDLASPINQFIDRLHELWIRSSTGPPPKPDKVKSAMWSSRRSRPASNIHLIRMIITLKHNPQLYKTPSASLQPLNQNPSLLRIKTHHQPHHPQPSANPPSKDTSPRSPAHSSSQSIPNAPYRQPQRSYTVGVWEARKRTSHPRSLTPTQQSAPTRKR